jgi:hypothetical protein
MTTDDFFNERDLRTADVQPDREAWWTERETKLKDAKRKAERRVDDLERTVAHQQAALEVAWLETADWRKRAGAVAHLEPRRPEGPRGDDRTWLELPMFPNDHVADQEITCIFCRSENPCEYSLLVKRDGGRAVVGIHEKCVAPLRRRNCRERDQPMEEPCASSGTAPGAPKGPVKIAEPKRSPVGAVVSPAASATPSAPGGSGPLAGDASRGSADLPNASPTPCPHKIISGVAGIRDRLRTALPNGKAEDGT